ncbi:MAG: multicopper oxidase domain-containing protein [Calditrichaeota bacterium]|nr:multicopper oxidase domain-containing protein [Calditrichota bacterium]
MNRRDFLKTTTVLSAAMLMPNYLLSKEVRAANTQRFPTPLEPRMDGDVKEFHLFIDIFQHEVVPGFRFHTLAFNNQIPGPEIRVKQGDKVRVIFKNKTELNHTIHWHGLHVPWRMDGVPYVTQMPVMPGQEFVYEFVAEPYGTHFYHCHWGTLLHMQSGMYGSFIIENDDDPIRKKFPYEREYTLIYSAHDSNFIRNELNAMLERMKERMYLMKTGRFDKKRFAVFNTKEEFVKAVEEGYLPPYVVSRRSRSDLPQPNWFTVNGKSYPMTPNLYIRTGETIRVRLINAGQLEYFLHLHGHDFWLVADDGLPIPQPWQMNTMRLSPGKTADIIIEGKNRGIWTFHDHDTSRVTNNGLYPGGNLLALVYEDLPVEETELNMMAKKMGLTNLPNVALDE